MATLARAFLFHIPARDLHVCHYPFTTCLETDPPLSRHTLLIGLSYFQAQPSLISIPQLFSNYSLFTYLPMTMEKTECSEKSAYKIQTPGNYPEENIQQNKLLLVTDNNGRTVFHVAAELPEPKEFQGIMNLVKEDLTIEEVINCY